MSLLSSNSKKRTRSSSTEPTSFAKIVRTRVSGLLPATITKWFNARKSNSNGSAPVADCTDSSTDDEAIESPERLNTGTPAKRMRLDSLGATFSKNASPELETSVPTQPEPVESQSSQLYAPPAQNKNVVKRDSNVASTSHADSEAPEDISNTDAVPPEVSTHSTSYTITPSSPSVATKRKSIFESTGVVKHDFLNACAQPSTSTIKEAKAPNFNPALFSSPFYPGRTRYGGASSTYIDEPNIKQRKIAYVQESPKDNTNVNMSYAARRVMDLLENYSSPLVDAKRIPYVVRKPVNINTTLPETSSPKTRHGYSYKTQELYVPTYASILQLKKRSRLMDTTNAARQIIASHSSTLSTSSLLNQQLLDNAQRDSSKNKESTTKLKTRLTRADRGEDPFELPAPVQLPTAVLQIDKDNLPKFSFSGTATQSATPQPAKTSTLVSSTPVSQTFNASIGLPSSIFASQPVNTSMSQPLFTFASQPSKTDADRPHASDHGTFDVSTSSRVINFSTINSTPKMSATESTSSNELFKFSTPVTVSQDGQKITKPPKFTFGSPERTVDKTKKEEVSVNLFPDKKIETEAAKLNDWKCPECWISNKADAEKCACCTTKRPSGDEAKKPAKCTVCKLADSQVDTDKCVNCERIQMSKSIALPIPMPADPTKWKCEDCWVSNEGGVDKCACCGSRNPKKPSAPAAPNKVAETTEKDWRCEDCYISNKSSVEKCAACGGAKPGSKPNVAPAPQPEFSSPFFRPPDQKLIEIAKAQKNNWECSSCLVRNDSSKSMCVCCGAERSGQTTALTKPTFNFDSASNTTFKFGIDPKVQESNINKKKEDFKMEPTRKLEEPETNNNTVSKIPTFTFTLPNKKAEDKSDSVKASEAPKSFTFGIPKQMTAATTTVTMPIFGTKLPDLTNPAAVEEKPQEVPKIDFKAPAQEAAKPFTGYFSPPPTQPSQEPAKAFSSFLPNSTAPTLANTSEKKDMPFSFSSPSSSAEKPQQPSTFSFSSTAGPSLFSPKSTVAPAATGITFGIPPKPASTTTAPGMSLFQTPNPTASTAGLSLFQNSEKQAPTVGGTLFQNTVTTTAVPVAPAAPAAPLFSFGSNGQTSQPQPVAEKPKFNFSFGSTNNADPPAFGSFKPPTFGSTTENNTASNAFAMPAPGALGGNGMAPANSLSGNPISGNGMPSNHLGGGGHSDSGMSGMQSVSGISGGQTLFGAPVQSENVWGANNSSSNMFGGSASAAPAMSKPAPFTFGTPNPFNASGAAGPAQPAPTLFGNQQPAQNLFGMPNQTGTQPALFQNPAQQQPPPSLFGNGQQQPGGGMFGGQSATAAPSFGAPAQTMPSFETAAAPQQAAPFSFGTPQPSGVFGFGAQQPQQQTPQAGVYNFGGGMGSGMGGGMSPAMGGGMGMPAMGGVQFNMGSAPATNVRRMRKAVRRNPQR